MMSEAEEYASFWEHLQELRSSLIYSLLAILTGMGIALYFHQELIYYFLHSDHQELFFFSPVEGFIAVFRFSFWVGVLGTSPFWISAILRFVKPALRGKEKEWLPFFCLLSALFIFAGFIVCFKMTLPFAVQYLFQFNQTIGGNLWGFSAYLDFVLMLLFSHGAAFELGALLIFLIHSGILKGEFLAKKRRHAIVASLIIGALLTPPDVFTQIAIAFPLIAFYELAILYGYFTRT